MINAYLAATQNIRRSKGLGRYGAYSGFGTPMTVDESDGDSPPIFVGPPAPTAAQMAAANAPAQASTSSWETAAGQFVGGVVQNMLRPTTNAAPVVQQAPSVFTPTVIAGAAVLGLAAIFLMKKRSA